MTTPRRPGRERGLHGLFHRAAADWRNVALVVVLVGLAPLMMRSIAEDLRRAPPPPDIPAPTVDRVHGGIRGEPPTLLASIAASRSPVMLFVLDSGVISTCEDLARQLREAVHSRVGRGRSVLILAPDRDSLFVRNWLVRERIGPSPMIASRGVPFQVGGVVVVAPAVLLMDRTLQVSAGIVHVTRVPNTRPISFAAELQLN